MAAVSNAVLVDAVEHLVRGIVSNPDDVHIDLVNGRRHRVIEVRVNPEDLGKVIGRQGRTVNALRTVIAGAGNRWVRIDVVDPERD